MNLTIIGHLVKAMSFTWYEKQRLSKTGTLADGAGYTLLEQNSTPQVIYTWPVIAHFI